MLSIMKVLIEILWQDDGEKKKHWGISCVARMNGPTWRDEVAKNIFAKSIGGKMGEIYTNWSLKC